MVTLLECKGQESRVESAEHDIDITPKVSGAVDSRSDRIEKQQEHSDGQIRHHTA